MYCPQPWLPWLKERTRQKDERSRGRGNSHLQRQDDRRQDASMTLQCDIHYTVHIHGTRIYHQGGCTQAGKSETCIGRRVGEAASISAAKRIGSTVAARKRSADLERTLSSMPGTEIVRRLNDGDIVMAQALTVPKQLELNCSNTVSLMRVCDSSNIPYSYRLTRTATLSN